ncbi:MAG: T9SS type A sorting domain-containing protein [Bacteroidia bacterium]|nr:T9SS type A sorting domain-containing protein [Bacteroidia bacterium]
MIKTSMKRWNNITLILCLFLFSFIGSNEAQVEMPQSGDSIFRFKALLEKPAPFTVFEVADIKFPCVDHLMAVTNESPRPQINYINQSDDEEMYSVSEGNLYLNGYKGHDPFLNLPDKEIVFLNPVQLTDSDIINKKKLSGESEFIVLFQGKELPESVTGLKSYSDLRSVQLNGKLKWEIRYVGEDRYFEFNQVVEGQVMSNLFRYSVQSYRIRTDKWIDVKPGQYPELASLFTPKIYQSRSLFAEDDFLPSLEFIDYPYRQVVYNAKRNVKQIPFCDDLKMGIQVFPNPTYGDLNIQFNNAVKQEYTFEIIDIIGRKLWSEKLYVNAPVFLHELDMPVLSKGVYLYGISNSKGQRIASSRLIIVEP